MKQDLVAIENKALYDEIEAHSGRLISILKLDILAVTGIVGVVFGHVGGAWGNVLGSSFPAAPVLLLLPLFVLIPSFTLAMSELNSIARIAAYISVYYERALVPSDDGPSSPLWQTAVQCLRNERTLGPTRLLGKALRYMLPSLALMCVALSVLSGVALNPGGCYITYMAMMWAFSSALVILVTVQLRNAWSTKYFEDLAECLKSACIVAETHKVQ